MSAKTQEEIPQFPQAEGFGHLLIGEQEFLRALIRVIGVPASDVGDVLQDTNLYLVENQTKYLPGTNFRAWAAQVARFRCLNYFRSKKRRPMVNLSEQALDLITGEVLLRFDENNARLRTLDRCLAKLPEDHRQLLDLVYAKGLPLNELARARRCSHAAIRKTVSRIRQALKSCIESNTET